MGQISLTLFTTFAVLAVYSLGTYAKQEISGQNELLQKRPSPVWLKSYRHLKPLNSFSVIRRDLPDIEFIDDAVNDVEKRFDSYDLLPRRPQYGKRASNGEGEGLQFDFYLIKFYLMVS